MPTEWTPKTVQFDDKLWKRIVKAHAKHSGSPPMNAFIRYLCTRALDEIESSGKASST